MRIVMKYVYEAFKVAYIYRFSIAIVILLILMVIILIKLFSIPGNKKIDAIYGEKETTEIDKKIIVPVFFFLIAFIICFLKLI